MSRLLDQSWAGPSIKRPRSQSLLGQNRAPTEGGNEPLRIKRQRASPQREIDSDLDAVPSVTGWGPPGPRPSGPERQPGNGHANVTARDSDISSGKPQPRETIAASRARTAGRPRRVKDSDSDKGVDQSDLSEPTHHRQAGSGPSNGRRHLDRTNSGASGRNRKDTEFRNGADPERPSRSREETEAKVK